MRKSRKLMPDSAVNSRMEPLFSGERNFRLKAFSAMRKSRTISASEPSTTTAVRRLLVPMLIGSLQSDYRFENRLREGLFRTWRWLSKTGNEAAGGHRRESSASTDRRIE